MAASSNHPAWSKRERELAKNKFLAELECRRLQSRKIDREADSISGAGGLPRQSDLPTSEGVRHVMSVCAAQLLSGMQWVEFSSLGSFSLLDLPEIEQEFRGEGTGVPGGMVRAVWIEGQTARCRRLSKRATDGAPRPAHAGLDSSTRHSPKPISSRRVNPPTRCSSFNARESLTFPPRPLRKNQCGLPMPIAKQENRCQRHSGRGPFRGPPNPRGQPPG